ncbi:hypothetical protein LTR70_003065 [Exophiala xenobiotica]|uniref:Uncharacterized protein n=1 Tax=Lithohypha guttulata TaxID=1690604 RepID=A0ABR0KJC9_9EURO|nr:hypothetical protein LTR24_002702 [Lithohypha guttulata]KAK5323776.1 hypothetical protein LTR70_003065 [Exophiala xenobiotica]
MSDMRTSTIPYSPAVFNGIGTLQAATEAFEARKAKAPNLLDLFRRVFVESGKNNAFGISLLHKHFSISDHQVLVELNNVATPWTVYASTMEQIQKTQTAEYEDGEIHATSWMVVPGGRKAASLMPFEFSFIPTDTIKRMDLQDVVALTAVPEGHFDGAVETTIEDKTILHLKGEHNVASLDHSSGRKHNVQASFFWPTKSDGTIPAKAKGTGCEDRDTCRATVPEVLLKELEEWGEREHLEELMALEELDDDMVVHCPRGCDPRDKWRVQSGRFSCETVLHRAL